MDKLNNTTPATTEKEFLMPEECSTISRVESTLYELLQYTTTNKCEQDPKTCAELTREMCDDILRILRVLALAANVLHSTEISGPSDKGTTCTEARGGAERGGAAGCLNLTQHHCLNCLHARDTKK
ncbi:hypothetical protein GE061_018699 [Apolygus lucorum]|uniref:Uncharacterized protein n=1 Tax=Apolygus lucorum TaxID=248454 RepID=A0A8S9X7P6_APOLU|nr:hypothetical protein GE061_018699 [Apolygus lucorum]